MCMYCKRDMALIFVLPFVPCICLVSWEQKLVPLRPEEARSFVLLLNLFPHFCFVKSSCSLFSEKKGSISIDVFEILLSLSAERADLQVFGKQILVPEIILIIFVY